MQRKLTGYLCMAAACLLWLLAAVTLVAMLRALTVSTTLAAIESAFGSLVLCLLFLLGAGRLKQLGLARLKPPQSCVCAETGN
jgi:hypothetical protein